MFYFLSLNPNAIYLIKMNLNKLGDYCDGWHNLCKNPNATHLIEKNLHRLTESSWLTLASNINAVHIFERILD